MGPLKMHIWQFHAWHLVLMIELSVDKQPWVAIFLELSTAHMTSFKTSSVHTFQLSSVAVPGSPLPLRPLAMASSGFFPQQISGTLELASMIL